MTTVVHTRLRGWRKQLVVAVVLVAAMAAVGIVATRAISSAATPRYYVSVGDSYAAGYRPEGPSGPGPSRDSFVYQVYDQLSTRDRGWQIENFGCTGQTAYGMSFDNGCQTGAGAVDGPAYPSVPQAVAAADFVTAHRDQIGLITIAAGGNDVRPCVDIVDPLAFQSCGEQAIPRVRLTIDALLKRLRETVGASVPIVGVSYIDVFVADALKGDPASTARAARAENLFENYLNPELRQTYARYGASFVDSTAVTGGDAGDDVKSQLPDGRTVPAKIARVCALTYYCDKDDPHPNRAGHALIAEAVARAVPA